MTEKSVFSQEWRDCLQAHYMHVVRSGDKVTLPTLTGVMTDAGFSEAELNELYVRATQHVDDVPDDFVPDEAVVETFQSPGEDTTPAADSDESADEDDTPPDDPNSPQQMSLF